jgi:hypothetical protein
MTKALRSADEREPLDLRAAKVDADPNRSSPMRWCMRSLLGAERYADAALSGTSVFR